MHDFENVTVLCGPGNEQLSVIKIHPYVPEICNWKMHNMEKSGL